MPVRGTDTTATDARAMLKDAPVVLSGARG